MLGRAVGAKPGDGQLDIVSAKAGRQRHLNRCRSREAKHVVALPAREVTMCMIPPADGTEAEYPLGIGYFVGQTLGRQPVQHTVHSDPVDLRPCQGLFDFPMRQRAPHILEQLQNGNARTGDARAGRAQGLGGFVKRSLGGGRIHGMAAIMVMNSLDGFAGPGKPRPDKLSWRPWTGRV